MPNVLVDQDELNQLIAVNDANNAATDAAVEEIATLKAELAKANEDDESQVNIQPLLDKANSIHDKLSGLQTPPPVTVNPVPETPPTADTPAEAPSGLGAALNEDGGPLMAPGNLHPDQQASPGVLGTPVESSDHVDGADLITPGGIPANSADVPAGEPPVDDPTIPTV